MIAVVASWLERHDLGFAVLFMLLMVIFAIDAWIVGWNGADV